MSMRIGLTMRIERSESTGEIRDALAHDWLNFLSEMGWTSVPLPNIGRDPAAILQEERLDGLILTGGEDTFVRQGGELPDNATVRDRNEITLLKETLTGKIPTLAICRGLQLVWLALGGQLKPGKGHVATVHEVRLFKNATQMVNSYHNQLLIFDNCPTSLEVLARDGEGFVEAVAHRNAPLLGVQWHPERQGPQQDMDRSWIKRLFEQGGVPS